MTAPVTSTRVGLKYPKTDRVRRRFEYLAAQKTGRRVHTTHFVVILSDRGDGAGPRLGVTASRKSGNSVLRHRVRRVLREVFRLNREAFPSGHDVVVLLRENTPTLDYAMVRDEVLGALARPRNRARPPSAKPGSSPNAGRSATHPERDGGRS